VVANRDSANYVYRTEDLAALAGSHYAKKRNLVQQATRLYAWRIEPLGPQHSQECLEVGDDIAAKRTTLTCSRKARRSRPRFATSLRSGFVDCSCVLTSAGRLLYLRPSQPDTALVLFERALRDKKGLYQVINQETARAIAAQG